MPNRRKRRTERKLKRWNDLSVAPEEVESAGVLRQLFFGNLFSGRRPRDNGQHNDESK